MIKMSRKAKKAMAVALTAGMLASTAVTPVMAATQGWKQNSKGWWYQNADGSYPANKWEKINGKWYYFNANGYMLANAWAKDSKGLWYYVGADGAMKTNAWAPDKAGLWYYVGNDGAMVTNTWKTDKKGLWYHLGADGVMEAGKWITLGDKSYFLDAEGVMQSGVIKVDGKTYYLGEANDGSMKTGTFTIQGVDYTFDATGACTDEKPPVAVKKFDAKGNLITEEVEVEEIDGITAEVVNAVSQYKEYGNVVMTGKDAAIKIKVTNNGKPVAGTAVSLSLKCESGVDTDIYEATSYVSLTDSNGYAAFVITPDKWNKDQTAVNGQIALYSFKATAVTSGEPCEGELAFATIDAGKIKVNPDDKDTLVMSTNAALGDKSVTETRGMDGSTYISYVKSQQVSLANSSDHKVTFELNPELVIPVGVSDKLVKDYNNEVNKTISEYSVYENKEEWITDVPVGLQYATLNLENIDISEHTKFVVEAYEAGKHDKQLKIIDEFDGAIAQKNTKLDLPIQDILKSRPDYKEETIDIKIKVVSEGQVNDNQNGGITVKSITGVVKRDKTVDTKKIALTNPVTWEQTDIEYTLERDLDFEEARKYIPSDDKDYLDEEFNYSYQVPVFPFVGNAIITVKDTNKKVLAYYTVPTVNEAAETSVNFKNVNVLDTNAYGKAILVTKDEAFNNVGTITPNGNRVTVNSSETGVTAFRAKISIDDEEYDLTNNTINTSVHWSPIPGTTKENDFYALSGQQIVVKAQLIDKAGNKVSKSGEPITFSYEGGPISQGNISTDTKDTKVTAMTIADKTDSDGCAKLVVQATDTQAILDSLTASAQKNGYDVVLNIGDETVETANLRWVTPGLSFTPAVDEADDELNTLNPNFNGEVSDEYAAKYLTKEAGSNWILGYQVEGDTQDDLGAIRYVTSIEGLKVNLSQDGEATMVTEGMKNGAAKLSTTKAEGIKLTGEIDETSLVAGTDVVFYVSTNGGASKAYKNVGVEKPFFAEEVSLTLPVLFGNVGTKMDIELPKGGNIDKTATDNYEAVYVKVADSFGNPIIGKNLDKVTVVYTLANGATSVTHVTDAKRSEVKSVTFDHSGAVIETDSLTSTDSYGVVSVAIKRKVNGVDVVKAEIKAEYDNESTTGAISFVEAKGDFVLLNANYDDTAKQATLTFSQSISNLKEDMISVINDNTQNAVGVSKVEVKNGNQVVVTFKNALKEDYTYTVSVVDGEDINDDGIADVLCDKYGRTLKADNKTVKLTVEEANLVAKYNGSTSITFEINNKAAADQKILCVWDGGSKVVTGSAGFNVNTITNKEVTEVKCYYNGDVEKVQLTDRVEAIAAAQEAMNGLDVDEAAGTISEQTYTAAGYIFLSKMGDGSTDWEDYKAAKVTIVKDDDNIFARVLDLGTPGGVPVVPGGSNLTEADPDGNLELALSNPLVTDVDATATVEVIYAHVLYPSVTRKVTYKVTLEDSNDGETADTIVFEAQ